MLPSQQHQREAADGSKVSSRGNLQNSRQNKTDLVVVLYMAQAIPKFASPAGFTSQHSTLWDQSRTCRLLPPRYTEVPANKNAGAA